MEKQKYPCVFKVYLSNGGFYYSEIQGFKSEDEFFKWIHNKALEGNKVNDWDDFLNSDLEVENPVQFTKR